ncbi:histone H1-like protein [Tanacetum coccineum]|uniref:Histone H1-like protein n=1 Tax=Tanacetum coccineum TaxID=301880 RepID=A0ABQ4Y8J2_9ASTR
MATEEVVAVTTETVTAEVVPATEGKGDVSKVKKAKKVTKSKPKNPALHPPYFEMIKEAIVSLKERTGSSQYAITKFIEEKQKNLPANFKKVLLTQLKKLVAGGKLVKVKASYKLPAAAPAKAKKKVAAKPKAKTVAKKAPAKPKAVVKAKPAAKARPAAKAKTVAKPAAKPKAAVVKSKAKPKTPTKPAKVARTSKRSTPGKKAPVAKAIAAKKTPVKKASAKSLKPKSAIAKKVPAGRKAKKRVEGQSPDVSLIELVASDLHLYMNADDKFLIYGYSIIHLVDGGNFNSCASIVGVDATIKDISTPFIQFIPLSADPASKLQPVEANSYSDDLQVFRPRNKM